MKTTMKLAMILAGGITLMLFTGGACTKQGKTGATGPAGTPAPAPPTNTALTKYDDLPGLVLTVTGVSGASGPNGAFQVGDKPKFTFTLKKSNGKAINLSEVDNGRVLLSGPSFNYQRVIAQASDLITGSVQNPDGSYTYNFATAIPATYLAPLNDTASFGLNDGELSGQALLAGTYTIGIQAYKNYTIDGITHRDAADSVTQDILFGSATTIAHREVVKAANCNQCHKTLQAHGGTRKNNTNYCILCHTSGAEDSNTASVNGGTPGVTVDFRSMIHKIHMGSHLPSVNGVGTTVTGARDYTVTPQPFYISSGDFSAVAFPAWPNFNIAMPRADGYATLTAAAKAQDDQIRKGPTNCALCHSDPDGIGPLTAPAQGSIAFQQPTRRSCGACHDDVDFSKPYVKNGLTMPAQANDSNCITCHLATGPAVAGLPPPTPDAHLHPLLNPAFNPGLNFNLSAVVEAGANNGNGKIDPGEKIAVTFTMTADDGSTAVLPASLTSNLSVVVNGPTTNRQMILYTTFPPAAITGASPYTINLPEPVLYQFTGTAANDAGIESFTVARAPTWDTLGVPAKVYCRTASGSATTLAAAAPKDTNYIDVASTAGFANNNFCVIDDGAGSVEYKQVGFVDTTIKRLWFKANSYAQQTALKFNHAAGAAVQQVTLTQKTLATDYTIVAATGTVTETANASFPAGQAVVVSYTTDFVMPATYTPALNNSPDLNETVGDWTGKPIVDGTYSVDIFGSISRIWSSPDGLAGDQTTFPGASPPAVTNFLVGATATTLTPWVAIDANNCNKCHVEPRFHGGGRRGFDTCAMCHTTSGAEDQAQFTTPTAPQTPGNSIEFRHMLHKIHRGEDLYYASTYKVVGNAGSINQYSEVAFPAMPEGVKNCDKCHGTSTNYHILPDRNHPTAQVAPVKSFAFSCLACHDGPSPAAHASLMTSVAGGEACGVCHGDGADYSVVMMHKPRP